MSISFNLKVFKTSEMEQHIAKVTQGTGKITLSQSKACPNHPKGKIAVFLSRSNINSHIIIRLQLRNSEQKCFHDSFLISQPNPMM